jgi:hypothetical protein
MIRRWWGLSLVTEYGRTGDGSRSQKSALVPPASANAALRYRPPEKSAIYKTQAYASRTCGFDSTDFLVWAMNAESLPSLDKAPSCSSISYSGLPVRAAISARKRWARRSPGSWRCRRREYAREHTLDSCATDKFSRVEGTHFESCVKASLSSALEDAVWSRPVGRCGESRMVCHSDSKVI